MAAKGWLAAAGLLAAAAAWAVLATAAPAAGAAALGGRPGAAVASDRMPHPAPQRHFAAPGGRFDLQLFTPDGWASRHAVAELRERAADGAPRLRWSQPLPQEYGPRFALVADSGHVLLLDEHIKVPSRYALMLIDADGRVRATHGFQDLLALVGEPRAVAEAARLGPWMSAPPALAADGRSARVGLAGRTLVVDLTDGALTLQR